MAATGQDANIVKGNLAKAGFAATQSFKGSLQSLDGDEPPIYVTIQLDPPRIRMWSDRHRMGSWEVDDVHFERQTIFRFVIGVDGESYSFTPDDPSGFASAVNVEIDLTRADKPRFGLAERLKQAAET